MAQALIVAYLLVHNTILMIASAAPSRSDRRGNLLQLIFNEEFDDFDLDTWRHQQTLGGGGNWEFQWYCNNRSNSFVRDGVLHLQPTLTSDALGEAAVSGAEAFTLDLWAFTPPDMCSTPKAYGCSRTSDAGARHALNPVQSARVSTYGGFSFAFGRLEVEAQIPRGDWLWPAVWLLPEHSAYGPWPASGEIDILESRGNPPGFADHVDGNFFGCDTVSTTLHWGPYPASNRYELTGATYKDKKLPDEFRTYGLYWDAEGLYSYVDGDENRILEVPFDVSFWERGGFTGNPLWAGRGPAAPFDRRFYILLNVAVGGMNFFPDVEGKPWTNQDQDAPLRFWEGRSGWLPTWKPESSALRVRSVRVWQAPDGDRSYSPEVARRMAARGVEVGADWGGGLGLPTEGSGGVDKGSVAGPSAGGGGGLVTSAARQAELEDKLNFLLGTVAANSLLLVVLLVVSAVLCIQTERGGRWFQRAAAVQKDERGREVAMTRIAQDAPEDSDAQPLVR